MSSAASPTSGNSSTKILMVGVFKCFSEEPEKLPVLLASAFDLSAYNYFTRSSIGEHLRFAARTIVQRTQAGTRQSVGLEDNPFLVHAYVRFDGLAGVLITHKDYIVRVAYGLIGKTLSDYERYYPDEYKKITTDQKTEPEFMKNDIKLYQNPTEADKLTKVQKNLDDVKLIMHKNIDEVLKRGETLDSLMDKSQDLSKTSLQFYKTAKKQNQCCKAY